MNGSNSPSTCWRSDLNAFVLSLEYFLFVPARTPCILTQWHELRIRAKVVDVDVVRPRRILRFLGSTSARMFMEPYASKPSAPSTRNPASVSSPPRLPQPLQQRVRRQNLGVVRFNVIRGVSHDANLESHLVARQSSLWCGVIATSSGETPVAIASAARIARSYPCLQGGFSS